MGFYAVEGAETAIENTEELVRGDSGLSVFRFALGP